MINEWNREICHNQIFTNKIHTTIDGTEHCPIHQVCFVQPYSELLLKLGDVGNQCGKGTEFNIYEALQGLHRDSILKRSQT